MAGSPFGICMKLSFEYENEFRNEFQEELIEHVLLKFSENYLKSTLPFSIFCISISSLRALVKLKLVILSTSMVPWIVVALAMCSVTRYFPNTMAPSKPSYGELTVSPRTLIVMIKGMAYLISIRFAKSSFIQEYLKEGI